MLAHKNQHITGSTGSLAIPRAQKYSAPPSICCFGESGGPAKGTFPFPEGRERLAITEEPKVGMKHGEVGSKCQALVIGLRVSLDQTNAVLEHEV